MATKNLYEDKVAYCDATYEYIEPMQFYFELFPEGTFQTEGEVYNNKANGMIIVCTKDDKKRTRIVYDDRTELEKLISNTDIYENHKFAFMAPVTYVGRRRLNDNAIKAYAIVIDIDQVDASNLKNLMNMAAEVKLFPVPTYIVVSGNGIHVYYVFDEPVELYEDKYEALDTLKALLITKMWNRYTSQDKNVQYQPITQAYRIPGSRTKAGKTVRAYRTGKVINIEDIISCLSGESFAEYRSDKNIRARHKYSQMRKKLVEYWEKPDKAFDELAAICYDMEHISLDEAKEMHPEWYQRRIVEGQPKGHYTSQKHLYYWWKNRIIDKASFGHRYFCILILVSYATRCEIPFEEVERDAYELLPIFDTLTPEGAAEKEHFTAEDVEHALAQYGEDKMYRYSNSKIEALTAIRKPEGNKRKPFKKNTSVKRQATHLMACRSIAKTYREAGLDSDWDKGGRPKGSDNDKLEAVTKYLKEHPDETNKAKIARECGVTRPTVYKYLQEM